MLLKLKVDGTVNVLQQPFRVDAFRPDVLRPDALEHALRPLPNPPERPVVAHRPLLCLEPFDLLLETLNKLAQFVVVAGRRRYRPGRRLRHGAPLRDLGLQPGDLGLQS